MRKILIASAAAVALAVGVAGVALAQNDGAGAHGPRGGHGFFQADANSDGTVTRQEFDASRAAEFTRLDADHNGELSRDEMRSGMRRGWGHRGGRGGEGGMHRLASLDTNNDGNITRDEFLARPIAAFDRMDSNHDGVISAAERPQRPATAGANAGDGQRRERPNFDTNGDQQISQSEFQAMGARMFDRLDANHDGRVTQAEAQAARPHRQAPSTPQ